MDIASAGPLDHVFIGDDLSCQVAHVQDVDYEYYPPSAAPADCGTLLVTDGHLFAPDFQSHDGTATDSLGSYTPFTAVSQTGVLGSGTLEDPYRVVTVGAVGATGLQITQTDTYVVGQESYRTDLEIANSGATAKTAILYRAADCYLGGSDVGFGFVDQVSGAVACQAQNGRVEEWTPITTGSHYLETLYDSVWSWIGGHTGFPDQCDCAVFEDNGAGISWDATIPAGGFATFSHLSSISPSGSLALSTQKTADLDVVPPGADDGYTITISNPNDVSVTLTSITDDLPADFTYIPGSTSGVTTEDPVIVGQHLSWDGSFPVPAGGSVALHFGVTAAQAPGDYLNDAGGQAPGYVVAPTGPTAQVTVTSQGGGADLSVTMTDAPDPVTAKNGLDETITVTNNGPEDATGVTAVDNLPA